MAKIEGMPTTKLTIKNAFKQETRHWTPIECDGKIICLVSDRVDNETYRAVRDILINRLSEKGVR